MLANISFEHFLPLNVNLGLFHSWTFALCFTILIAGSLNRYYDFQYHWFRHILPNIRYKQGNNGVVHLFQNEHQIGIFYKYKYFPTTPSAQISHDYSFYFIGLLALITGFFIEEHHTAPIILFFLFIWAGYFAQMFLQSTVEYSLHEGILRAGYKTF